MTTENNPYRTPPDEPQPIEVADGLNAPKIIRAFKYSYFTSLVAAFTVVPIWLTALSRATLPGQRASLWPPDMLKVLFLLLTTVPSILTCWFFSITYCNIFRMRDDSKMLRMWPAVLFGVLSGLAINAMTAITLIEYFIDW